jgi:hypothetical protein
MAEVVRKLPQEPRNAVLLRRCERLTVDPRSTVIAPDAIPRLLKDVAPPDVVMKGVEPTTRMPLGCDEELALEATDVIDGLAPTGVIRSGGPDHSRARTCCARVTKVGALPSGHVLLHAHPRYCDPLGLPLRTARFRHRLIRAALP